MKAMHSMSAKKALHAMFLQQRARMPCIVPKSQPLKTEDGHEPYAQAHTFPFLGAGSRIAAGNTSHLHPMSCYLHLNNMLLEGVPRMHVPTDMCTSSCLNTPFRRSAALLHRPCPVTKQRHPGRPAAPWHPTRPAPPCMGEPSAALLHKNLLHLH